MGKLFLAVCALTQQPAGTDCSLQISKLCFVAYFSKTDTASLATDFWKSYPRSQGWAQGSPLAIRVEPPWQGWTRSVTAAAPTMLLQQQPQGELRTLKPIWHAHTHTHTCYFPPQPSTGFKMLAIYFLMTDYSSWYFHSCMDYLLEKNEIIMVCDNTPI